MPAGSGSRTAEGRLIRADNLQDLTPDDISLLVDKLGVQTVVDLRSSREVEKEGPGPLRSVPEVRHAHHSVLPEIGAATDAAAEDALLTRRERILERYPDDYMCGMYLGYLEDRPESVVAALREVAHSEGAAVVHCAAGKDRTGVVVAMALAAVETDWDAIVADYAATGERIEEVLDRLRATPTYAADIDRIPVDAHTPREATMHSFLTEVDARFGGPAAWLEHHGFTHEDLGRLRTVLVDGGAGDRS